MDAVQDDPLITYSFSEAIDRVLICENRNDLNLLCEFLAEEQRMYSLYHLKLIAEAVRIKREEFNK